MPFTGQLGSDDSQLGQIILGQDTEAQQGGGNPPAPTGILTFTYWVDGIPFEYVQSPSVSTSGLAFWVDGLVSEGMFVTSIEGAGTQSILAEDSGIGTDNGSVAATIPANETSLGTDNGSTTASIPASESGIGAEENSIIATIPASESGNSSDDGVVGINVSDSNQSFDNAPGPDVFVFVTDNGHGEENSFLNNATFIMTDEGHGEDTGTITATISVEDVGRGVEDAIIGINGADAGSSLDAIPNIDVVVLTTDSGSSNESITTSATVLVSDIGVGNENGLISLFAEDSGQGIDTVTTTVSILCEDSGTGQDILDVPEKSLVCTDMGHGEESTQIDASILVTDGNSDPDFVIIGILAFEDGFGTEFGTPGIAVGDSGSSNENQFFGDNQTSIHDFGFGLDLVDRSATAVSGTFTDEGHGEDLLYLNLVLQDIGQGVDTASLSGVQIFASDSGHGEDSPVISQFATDSGQGSDSLSLNVVITDFGFISEPYYQLDKSEAGPCLDEAHLLEIATAPDFTSFCSFGPETLLPTWHVGRADTASLAWKFLQVGALLACPLNEDISRVKLLQRLPSAQVRENRMLWLAKFAYSINEDLHVQWIGTDGSSGLTRRAATLADFESATDPVWLGDPISKTIKMRNLMMKEAQLVSDTGVYSISDSVGLVPDVGIYWRIQDKHPFRWVDPEGSDYNGNNLTFTLPYNGNIFARYASQATLNALASGSVVFHWAGGQTIRLPLVRSSQPNIFDGYGSLIGMSRIRAGELEEEDNLSFKRRMLIEILAPPDPTLDGVIRGIASRLAQLQSTEWDGITSLNLDTTGASGITSIKVVGVDRILSVNESLTAASGISTKFYATEAGWRPGYIVFLDGVPQPNASVSGNVVTLQVATSGAVDAEYSVQQYSLSSDASGNILSIEPGNGLPSGSYTVVYTKNVRAYVVDLPEIQRTKLLLPDGNPNQLFLEISGLLTEGNPTTFGRARWGANAYWFNREEDRPGVARLPVTFDAND